MSMLPVYVQGWRESAEAVLSLVDDLTPEQWATPTDCPGWTVKDVVAHLAHLEAVLAGLVPDVTSDGRGEIVSHYTEAGVAARRGRAPADDVAELSAAVARREEQLTDLPDDPTEVAPKTPGDVGWTWDTLLRNRCIDLWVHEQDLRRALDRPGGFDGTAAQVVTMAFSFGMPYVVGKKVKPVAGTTVQWTVTGQVPVDLAVRVGDDGRASRVDEIDGPVTELTMSTEAFTTLAAGRRRADQLDVTITGDELVGRAVLDTMAITP